MARIAVIEDDTALLDLLQELFVEQGWELLASTGGDALPAMQREQPDAILLDLVLEGPESGWAILEQLKRDLATRSIPVIVWSGAVEQLREKAGWLAEQGIPTLEKPFDIDALYATVTTALEHRLPQLEPGRETSKE
jgi:twitching motility two-component system response regulator PilH